MDLRRAERAYQISAVLILYGSYTYALRLDSISRECIFTFTTLSLLFWVLGMRGLCLLTQAVVATSEFATADSPISAHPNPRPNLLRPLLLGLLTKAVALLILAFSLSLMTDCGARYFAFSTIAYVFCGAVVMLVWRGFESKNK